MVVHTRKKSDKRGWEGMDEASGVFSFSILKFVLAWHVYTVLCVCGLYPFVWRRQGGCGVVDAAVVVMFAK